MTYLDLVNGVLRRLREDPVSTVNATTYSRMVADFVNDAKQLVEDSWDWTALRTTLTVVTQADIFNYVLVGSKNKIKALDVINDSSDKFMDYRPSTWFNEKYLNQAVVSGSPQYWTYNGVDAEGDTQIDVYPKPDAAYTIRFNCIQRTDDLALDGDKLLIPAQPVLHLAVAMASRERGETGGTSTAEYFGVADGYLSNAIALDAQKHPDETIWYAP